MGLHEQTDLRTAASLKAPLSLTRTPSIGGGVAEEHHTGIPACQGVSHLGPLPRQRYPLVALLTLAEQEGNTHIVSPDVHGGNVS